MPRDQWDDKRLELLKTLWARGATAAAIAERLGGISRSAVLGKIFRLRLDARVASAPGQGNSRPRDSQIESAPRPTSSGRASTLASIPVRRRHGHRTDPTANGGPARKGRGKSLLELTNDCCRWPHGRPGTRTFFFCGAPGADLEHGMPYCARHARRAYRIPDDVSATTLTTSSASRLRLVSSARQQGTSTRPDIGFESAGDGSARLSGKGGGR